MKILHIAECIKGGVATYINDLYDNKSLKDKYYFFVPSQEKNFLSNNIKKNNDVTYFYRKKRNFKFFINFYIFLIKNIKAKNPDIIHLHSTFSGFFVRLYYFFKIKRPKIIYCSHGWSFLMDTSKIKKIIYIWVEKILSLKTDVIINISDYEYKKSISYGINKNKSIVINNAINTRIKKHNKKIIDYKKNKINFLFVGRLDRQKGFNKLYNYFSQKTNYILHVVGESVIQKKEYIKRDNIIFYGWINSSDIHNCYLDSDVVIIPSRWEGFGLVAIEAMKYSKPTIVSNRGALKEVVDDGANGFVFDFNNFNSSLKNAIEKFSKYNYDDLCKNSYNSFVKKYTIDILSKKINDLYKKIGNNNVN